MLENDQLIPQYSKEHDFTEDTNKESHIEVEGFYGVDKIHTGELQEPDLDFFCRSDEAASGLLNKCIKMMNEKEFNVMEKYLKEIGK